MRIIKFRSWNKESGEMGYPPKETGKGSYIRNAIYSDGIDLPEVIMQFTNLFDKNGKEVYERDIVKCSKGCRHEVVFMDEVPTSNIGGMPGFYLNGLDAGYAWTGTEEIVGNIFENPELLNDKNK